MFEELLRKLAEELDRRAIPYMIIGGQALLLYGEPRLTRDIDVTLGMDASQVHIVREMLDSLEFAPLVKDLEGFARKTSVVPAIDEPSGIRTDFILSFSEYEQLAMQRATTVRMREYPVKFASKEDLVIHKIIAGRPRDLEDVRSVLRKQSMDKEYIMKWLGAFEQGLSGDFRRTFASIYEEVQKE
ncbi:MAG: nucleotidyl transferase AbiEii/AbiGii toxin family protein [Syntrophobacteria bacterium]